MNYVALLSGTLVIDVETLPNSGIKPNIYHLTVNDGEYVQGYYFYDFSAREWKSLEIGGGGDVVIVHSTTNVQVNFASVPKIDIPTLHDIYNAMVDKKAVYISNNVSNHYLCLNAKTLSGAVIVNVAIDDSVFEYRENGEQVTITRLGYFVISPDSIAYIGDYIIPKLSNSETESAYDTFFKYGSVFIQNKSVGYTYQVIGAWRDNAKGGAKSIEIRFKENFLITYAVTADLYADISYLHIQDHKEIGELSELETVERETIVGAINELAKIGTYKFKGYVSPTQPTGNIKNGELWYQSDEMPTTFPINVKRYNNGVWGAVTETYEPSQLDLWADLENEHGYYWFSNKWRLIDLDVSLDNISLDKNVAGQAQIAENGVTTEKIKDKNVTYEKLAEDVLQGEKGIDFDKQTKKFKHTNEISDIPTESKVLRVLLDEQGHVKGFENYKYEAVELDELPNAEEDTTPEVCVVNGVMYFKVGSGEPTPPTKAPGLYQTGTDTLKMSWDEIKSTYPSAFETEGIINQGIPNSTEGDLVISDEITAVGISAFSGCSGITSITIPDSVTSIVSYAFEECSSLTSVTIGNGVTYLGQNAFFGCSSLTSIEVDGNNANYKSIDGNLYSKDGKLLVQYAVGQEQTSFVIPDSVTSIGRGAFYRCSSLTSVTIPDSVTSIGANAFYGCSNLTDITINATTPPALGLLAMPNEVQNIYVPAESVGAYKSATNWSPYAGKIKAI